MKRKTYDWTLPPEIERRLGESSYGRQRAIFEVDHLLLILHAPPGPDDLEREFRVFLRTPDGRFQCNGRPEGETQLRRLVGEYRALGNELEEAYRKAQTSEELFELIERVAPPARSAGNMRDALQSARELVKHDAFLIAMRDEAYEIARNFELLLGDARGALDFRIARHAETQAARSADMALAQHKLNILAAITFPLMALATLFGMNLSHGMGNNPFTFYVICLIGIVIGFALKSWVTDGADKDPHPRRRARPPEHRRIRKD
ncbi:MAG: hypothetical protein JW818_18725 [Pirellulales bacterium]|nr:hypothetical protein [Pirellulales bacterium]